MRVTILDGIQAVVTHCCYQIEIDLIEIGYESGLPFGVVREQQQQLKSGCWLEYQILLL